MHKHCYSLQIFQICNYFAYTNANTKVLSFYVHNRSFWWFCIHHGHSFESWNWHQLYKFLKFMVKFWPISAPEHRTTKWKFWMIWWAIYYIWAVEIPRFRQFFAILPTQKTKKQIPSSLPDWKRREFRWQGARVHPGRRARWWHACRRARASRRSRGGTPLCGRGAGDGGRQKIDTILGPPPRRVILNTPRFF